MKERRCMKATLYFYVPDAEDINDSKTMKYWMTHSNPGRIQFFDEHGNKVGSKMKAFDNLGQMLYFICEGIKIFWKSRFKKN